MDAEGRRILPWILVSLLIVYAGYQLKNGEFVNFLHYATGCGAGSVDAFEFLLLLPQLYVNYHLKTVAGMNRSALA